MLYFLIAIIMIFVIFIIIAVYVGYVDNNSNAIINLKNINNNYDFYNVNRVLRKEYDNETFYDSISCKDYITYELQFIRYDVYKEIEGVKGNQIKYKEYKKEVEEKCELGKLESKIFIKKLLLHIEKRRFEKLFIKPLLDYKILVVLRRVDKGDKFKEEKRESFNESEIKEIIERLKNKNGYFYNDRDIWDSLVRVERGRVSNKMRFAIYSRDGYRCKCCGRKGTREDLEIDHIVPVAKGGKSEWNNLQTLCPRCNKEKGTKTIRY